MSDEKRITIQTIAEEAQVSKSTVSCFLNGKTERMSQETRQRIAAVIKKYHYRPSAAARLLTAGRSCLLGVLVCDITNGFSNRLVKKRDTRFLSAPVSTMQMRNIFNWNA